MLKNCSYSQSGFVSAVIKLRYDCLVSLFTSFRCAILATVSFRILLFMVEQTNIEIAKRTTKTKQTNHTPNQAN